MNLNKTKLLAFKHHGQKLEGKHINRNNKIKFYIVIVLFNCFIK